MKNMSISELKEAKKKLEDTLFESWSKSLKDFYDETGVEVKDVTVNFNYMRNIMGEVDIIVTDVKVKINI
jgi:hypothetical protein